MKNQEIHQQPRSHPPLRSERRAAERVQRRQRSARQARISPLAIVGCVVTVLAVCAILIYGIVSGATHSSSSSAPGLTDPNALNPAPSMLSVGQQAPDFTLRDNSGKTYRLSSQRGHPVLLEFFAVWCPVCQAEAPTIARLTRAYTARGVRVWGILASPYGKDYETSGRTDLRLAGHTDLTWYAYQFNVHHPQLIDPNFVVVNQYGVSAYPGLYVVNGKGVISHVASGRESYAALSQALDSALRSGGR